MQTLYEDPMELDMRTSSIYGGSPNKGTLFLETIWINSKEKLDLDYLLVDDQLESLFFIQVCRGLHKTTDQSNLNVSRDANT